MDRQHSVIKVFVFSTALLVMLIFFGISGFCQENSGLTSGGQAYENGVPARSDNEDRSDLAALPVRFYRKVISPVDSNRCAMTPTCSSYSVSAIKKHGALMGWIMTCDRLLRCGRDEVRLSKKSGISGRRYSYDPVENNDFWWGNAHSYQKK
jgi:putative membrane protein insertion efficiency factor